MLTKRSVVIVILLVINLLHKSTYGETKGIIHEFVLAPIVRDQFENAIKGINLDPYEVPDDYSIIAGLELQRVLPIEVKSAITNMHKDNGPDLIIIHNFPVDSSIPETPRNSKRSTTKGITSEAAILGISTILNAKPFFSKTEKDGMVINQIIPIESEKHEKQRSSFGSKLDLLPHTENVYQTPPLKYFSLLCLRPDPKVATSVVFLNDILLAFEAKYPDTFQQFLSVMQQPLFKMSSGPSHEKTQTITVHPIIQITKSNETILRLNLNPGRTVGITSEAQRVVDLLTDLITSDEFKEKYCKRIFLKSGDLILFNNWKVMHMRDGFKIDPNNWRWLQRCYFQ